MPMETYRACILKNSGRRPRVLSAKSTETPVFDPPLPWLYRVLGSPGFWQILCVVGMWLGTGWLYRHTPGLQVDPQLPGLLAFAYAAGIIQARFFYTGDTSWRKHRQAKPGDHVVWQFRAGMPGIPDFPAVPVAGPVDSPGDAQTPPAAP